MNPFSTVAKLEAYWRLLTDQEKTRAETMIQIMSDRLRLSAQYKGIDMDLKIASDPAYASVASWVVMESVKRSMTTPADQPPVESYSQTAGVYSENYKYANPTGDSYFKKAELAALGLGGKQSLRSISTTPNDIYSPYYSS